MPESYIYGSTTRSKSRKLTASSSPSMQPFISKIYKSVIQRMLQLTLYNIMRSSNDFEDVKAALNDRTSWSIELFRSCFTIHLSSNCGHFFMLCALSFLVMAENIHVHYGRLSPTELKERVENIGYANFAMIFVMLDVGTVIVRIAGLVALSGSPALATSLTLASMSPPVFLPILAYPAKLLWKRKRRSSEAPELESGTELANANGLEVQT